ncbi:DUF402 domain-containing protein [Paenibacillus sp. MBLB4367]|uniref:DUF402 domain-containing protein n=1 Tax=Paenibacillus sp. MBLB4367 TaxID=3384767 RepID=UPI0039083228
MIERKIRYDGSVVEYDCTLLDRGEHHAVLLHRVASPFSIPAGEAELLVPSGSHTIAFYWTDKAYNAYLWRDESGSYIGSYFNIVRHTWISDEAVIFEDMIVDVVALPCGSFFVLDEEELPCSLELFEKGSVQASLASLTDSLSGILLGLRHEIDRLYPPERAERSYLRD